MADNNELVKALLAGVRVPEGANALAGGPPWRSWGSYEMAQQQPNWFGRNVLGGLGVVAGAMPPGAFDAMSVVVPGAKIPLPRPQQAAVRVGGQVFTGANHGVALEAAEAKLGRGVFEHPSFEDGFVTDQGNFLNRSEATAAMKSADPGYRPALGETGLDSTETRGMLRRLTPDELHKALQEWQPKK